MLTFRQLSYFKALATHRHFGRAAEACHVSQPALSVQIRDLEAHLGGMLVERRAREVLLTGFGTEVLTRAEAVLQAVRALEDLGQSREGRTGILRLGLIPTVAPYLLPGMLAALRAEDIQRDLKVQEAKTDTLLERLEAGEIDAAVVALPVDGVHVVPLFEDRFLLAGAARGIAALPADLDPTGFGAGRLLLLEDGHCLSEQALEVCGRDRRHKHIEMTASSLATLARLAAEGFGMTLLPEIALAEETAGPTRLALRRFSAPEPSRTLGLVRRRTTPGEGWFTDLAALITRVGEGLTSAARGGGGTGDALPVMQDIGA